MIHQVPAVHLGDLILKGGHATETEGYPLEQVTVGQGADAGVVQIGRGRDQFLADGPRVGFAGTMTHFAVNPVKFCTTLQ